MNSGAVRERHRHGPVLGARSVDRRADDRHAVRVQLGESIRAEPIWTRRVACGEAMELLDSRVAVRLVVDHSDPVPGPCQHQRCRESGGAAADDEHVAGGDACGSVHEADTTFDAEASASATCG